MSAPAPPRLRRVQPLSDQLVFERTMVWDADRGVHILHGYRRAKQPTTEQLAVHYRMQELADRLAAGDPEPPVRWIRETWRQRLVRMRNRMEAWAKARRGPARLEGLST